MNILKGKNKNELSRMVERLLKLGSRIDKARDKINE